MTHINNLSGTFQKYSSTNVKNMTKRNGKGKGSLPENNTLAIPDR